MEFKNSDIGIYTISETALSEIAAIATKNVKNVYPVKKDNSFVECKIKKQNEPIIKISVRVKQGIDIVKLCNKIQDDVRENILLMTSLDVKKINIDIQGFVTK